MPCGHRDPLDCVADPHDRDQPRPEPDRGRLIPIRLWIDPDGQTVMPRATVEAVRDRLTAAGVTSPALAAVLRALWQAAS